MVFNLCDLNRNQLFTVLLGVLLASSACGKKNGTSIIPGLDGTIAGTNPIPTPTPVPVVVSIATCDRSTVATYNVCIEVIGSIYNDPGYIAAFNSSCQTTGGTASTALCDHTGSLGSCVINGTLENEVHTTYFTPQYNATTARSACESGGIGVYTPTI